MANHRHLKILEQGVDTWNKWREENAEIKPNLRGANLKGKNLAGADFSDADIRSTNFTGAILTKAKFCQAKAGLKRRWAILLVLGSWVLALLSGMLLGLFSAFVSLILDSSSFDYHVGAGTGALVGWASLILLIIFLFVTLRQGIISALGVLAYGYAVAGVVTFAAFVARAFTLAGALALPSALAGAGA